MSTFPVWHTLEVEINGGNFEFDLVLVSPKDISVICTNDYCAAFQFMDNVNTCGNLRLVGYTDECMKAFLDFLQSGHKKLNKINCIYLIKRYNNLYTVDDIFNNFGTIVVTTLVPNTVFHKNSKFVLIQLRSLEKPTGASVAA
jgi:hypothetical protein